MNIGAGSLEFAHARIWAHWGQRADEWVWHRIEVTRDLAAVLDLVRASPLARWTAELGPQATPHAIEHAFRQQWRERVAEVARWMPPEWQPAIAGCALLVELPLLQHLARGGAAPPRTADDARLRVLHDPHDSHESHESHESRESRQARELHQPHQSHQPRAAPAGMAAGDPLLELLAAARADPERIGAHWFAQWRSLLPRGPGRTQIERELLPLLARHAAAFAAPDAIDGWGLRQTLHGRLVVLLRRAVVQPIAAFVHLALAALEGERLRAELVARAAFPHRAPARAMA